MGRDLPQLLRPFRYAEKLAFRRRANTIIEEGETSLRHFGSRRLLPPNRSCGLTALHAAERLILTIVAV